MNYRHRSIKLNFKKKIIFYDDFQRVYYNCVVATKEEIDVFEKEFLKKGIYEAPFRDFKTACKKHGVPFNGNKKYARIYGKLEFTQDQYIDIEDIRKLIAKDKDRYKIMYIRSDSDIIDFALDTLKRELKHPKEPEKLCTDDCKYKLYVDLQREIFSPTNNAE